MPLHGGELYATLLHSVVVFWYREVRFFPFYAEYSAGVPY
jgi:hypothetical protein